MPVISVRNVTKSYGGLRPFRLRALDVEPGELVAIGGMDRPAAAVLTDLLTGTTLPDNDNGSIAIGGRATSALSTQEEWLAFLDRFGLVNDRVVLLDALTAAANLAVPLTLDIDPMPDGVRGVVGTLAAEVGLAHELLDARLQDAAPTPRLLVRLGRALAHDPGILILEHPTAEVTNERDVAAFAATLRRIVGERRLAAVVATADPRLPRRMATRHVAWQPASGELSDARGWRRWFS